MLKCGRLVQIFCFDREEDLFILRKIYRKCEIWQINGNLRRRHFLLNCRQVICIAISSVQQYRWRCMSPWRYLEEIRHRSLATQSPVLSLQNLLISSNHPHNSLSSCCYSLLFPIIVLEHPDTTFSQPKPLNLLPNRHGPFVRLRLKFLSFFKGVLFQNFNRVVELELLVMGVQRLEDIFSIVSTDLRNWLNIIGSGSKRPSAERSKSGDDCKT